MKNRAPPGGAAIRMVGGAPGAADDPNRKYGDHGHAKTSRATGRGGRRRRRHRLVEDAPEEVFKRFDTDGSGEIDLEEFKVMLKKLKIHMSSAKAVKYFKMCDVDDSGQIDFEEFRVALFACDPNNGNPIGFAPNALLTPIDAFEMFDEDGSGNINEDEFYFVLEYLKLEVSDANQERLFLKYDKDQSGEIDYDEFRQIWLAVADVKKELTDAVWTCSKFASRKKLERILEKCLDEEEEQERRAMAEAERWRTWRAILDQKNEYIKHARRRAQIELCKGVGCRRVKSMSLGEVLEDSSARRARKDGTHEIVQKFWTRRVTAGKADFDPDRKMDSLETKDAIDVEALKNELASSPFNDLVVAENAAKLWGKRVYDAAISDTRILAQSDLGELWTWGGSDHWWYEIEPDAHWQTHWRGDTTPPRFRSCVCSMSAMTPPPPEVDELEGMTAPLQARQAPPPPKSTSFAKRELNDGSEALKVVLTYYGKWSAPPPDVDRRKFYATNVCPTSIITGSSPPWKCGASSPRR